MSHEWTHIPSLQEFEDGDIISATEMNDLHDEIKNSVNDFVDEVDAVINVNESDINVLEELTTEHTVTLAQHGLDISAHGTTLNQHTSTLSNHGSRLTSIEANQEIDEGNIEELGIRMTDAEDDISGLKTLTTQHTSTLSNHSTRLTSVENAQETDADNIELINERLGNAEDDIDDLESDVATVKSTVSSHTSTLSSHTSTLTEHGNRLTQDGQYIIALEDAMSELADDIEDLDGNVTELSEEVSELNTDLSTLASKKASATLGLVKAGTATAEDNTAVRITSEGYMRVKVPPAYDDTEIRTDIENLESEKVGYSEVVGGQLLMYADSTKSVLLATLDLPTAGAYWCTYGVTTYAEIVNAVNSGKYVLCKHADRVYRVSSFKEGETIRLEVFHANSNYYIEVKTNNTWSTDSNAFLYSGTENIKSTVKTGLTNGGTWTSAEQTAAQNLLGISGGGGGSDVLMVQPGVTTYEEAKSAFLSGKIVLYKADAGSNQTVYRAVYNSTYGYELYFQGMGNDATILKSATMSRNGTVSEGSEVSVVYRADDQLRYATKRGLISNTNYLTNSEKALVRQTLGAEYERFARYEWDGVSGTATTQDTFSTLSSVITDGGAVKAILKAGDTRYITGNIKYTTSRIDFFFDEITDYIPGDVVTFKRLRVTHTSGNVISVSNETINIDV